MPTVVAHAQESGFQLFSQNWAALFLALVMVDKTFRATLARPNLGLRKEPNDASSERIKQQRLFEEVAPSTHPECKSCTSSTMFETIVGPRKRVRRRKHWR
jgi:hypothetical protein